MQKKPIERRRNRPKRGRQESRGPSIFFLCPDLNEPLGGIRTIYRHVDILNGSGLTAFVLHHKRGFRCTWFKNNTKIAYLPDARLNRSDYLVVPEIYGRDIPHIKPGIRKVILNQGAYLTFSRHAVEPDNRKSPYQHKDIGAAVVVSEDSKRYLRYVFPELKVLRVRLGIDDTLFRLGTSKQRQIAFMPRSLLDDAIQVINILSIKGLLKGFSVVPIQNRSEQTVTNILKKSAIFLSFSSQEGAALPPMEAMACGCIVIGYTGRAGKEYFKPSFSYPVEDGDIIGFARTAERVLRQYRSDKTSLLKKGQQASRYIQKKYSLAQEARTVRAAWQTILKRQPR